MARQSKGASLAEQRRYCLSKIQQYSTDPVAYIRERCQIYDGRAWGPFEPWPAQVDALRVMADPAHQLIVALKARQLGMTWLGLCLILWMMHFQPAATVLLFSRRDDEAVDLLRFRLRGIYERLPFWLQGALGSVDNDHELQLENGSRVMAFPTTAGDSYTASYAFVDEADLVPDLDALLAAVKPTIDNGGRMLLLSRANKAEPNSPFKRIYAAARRGENGWTPLFLPWHAHPGRDERWYTSQRTDILQRTGSLDRLHEQYPATDAEALSPRSLDKRIPPEWLTAAYAERAPLPRPADAPPIAGLELYQLPARGHRYVVGGDPAEGNPTSDDSASTVLDLDTGEECASLAVKLEPDAFAHALHALAGYYHMAEILVERNNHGHAVLLRLADLGARLVDGPDGKPGWLSNRRGKAMLYDEGCQQLQSHTLRIHSWHTYLQLSSIEGQSLRAPTGCLDDRAVGFMLAAAARASPPAPGLPAAGGTRPTLDAHAVLGATMPGQRTRRNPFLPPWMRPIGGRGG